MKNLLTVAAAVLVLASCNVEKPLYTWYKYENTSYAYLKKKNDKSTQQLMEDYQKIIDKQKGSRMVPPPGVYADYGFMLMQDGKTPQGRAMLEREVKLYPESKVFLDRILQMTADTKEEPAKQPEAKTDAPKKDTKTATPATKTTTPAKKK